MGQKLLLFISIVLLFIVNSYANSNAELPALPINSALEIVEENSEPTISLWQKIKNFFGFGDQENKVVESGEDTEMTTSEDTTLPDLTKSKSMDDEAVIKQIIDNPDRGDKTFLDKNISINDKSDSKDLSVERGFNEDEALKLPAGFSEDDMKKLDLSEAKEIDDSVKSETMGSVLADKTDEIKDDIKQKISDSVEDLKLPGGFEDIKSDASEEIKLPNIDGSECKVKNVQEAIKQEETKIEVKRTSSMPDLVKNSEANSSIDDNKIVLPTNADTKQDVLTKSESVLKSELPTPTYALTPDLPEKEESNISKFAKAFENKKSNKIELPKITEEDFVTSDDGNFVKKESIELDSTQLQFVNNEAQVLILPNDDVVLGKLTKQAIVDNMDLHSYIKKFWENYNRLEREPKREKVENFIEEYDENFNKEDFI